MMVMVMVDRQRSNHCMSRPLAGEHDLVAVGVDAHGEVGRLAVFGFGLAGEGAAGGDDFGGGGDDVGDLEGDAGPGFFAAAVGVDGDGGAVDGDVGDVWVLAGDLAREGGGVELGGAGGVGGPDGVFYGFNNHGGDCRAWSAGDKCY